MSIQIRFAYATLIAASLVACDRDAPENHGRRLDRTRNGRASAACAAAAAAARAFVRQPGADRGPGEPRRPMARLYRPARRRFERLRRAER